MTQPDIEEVAGRPRRYWNVDGMPCLAIGLLWMLWGGYILLMDMPLPRPWQGALAMGFLAFMVLPAWAANWMVKRLKARYTFPRTGYVELPPPNAAQKVLAALVAAGVSVAISFLAFKAKTGAWVDLTPPAAATLLAVAFLIAHARQKMPDALWLAAASLVFGLGATAARLGTGTKMGCLFVALGLVSTILGALRLKAYLRLHPLPARSVE